MSVVGVEVESVMHWTCPVCRLEWLDRGRGFPGTRFSTCMRCRADALEPADARTAWRRPVVAGPIATAESTPPAAAPSPGPFRRWHRDSA